jgi:hypothetical protein
MTTTTPIPQFWRRVLAAINAHGWDHGQWNHQLDRFGAAWTAAEGTAAKNNPLSCTLQLPGATAFNTFTVDGHTYHVWNYLHGVDGIAATIQTLLNDLYPTLAGHLQGGVDSTKTAEQIVADCRADISRWGTNSDTILGVLAGTP